MSHQVKDRFKNSIVRQIKSSRKQVTIMFTDMVGSTKLWDTGGDIKGRLMVDIHNRLIFPVIKHYKGKIVKTIGDAIMAAFNHPESAVLAAIGIQQMLQKNRRQNEDFGLKIRIGLHTGKAIVEHKDVFGDVVNVAARVESRCKGNEILISENTVAGLKKKKFDLVHRGSFTPKGKSEALTIFQCPWQEVESLIDNIRIAPFLPRAKRQKFEILLYAFATCGILYFLYLKYACYFIADSESMSLFSLNPGSFISVPTAVQVALGLIALVAAILLIRTATVPLFILRSLKGGFGLCLGFFIFYLSAFYLTYLAFGFASRLDSVLYQSEHLFVEVKAEKANIFRNPSVKSEVLQTVHKGDLLLMSDVRRKGPLTWNKVLIGKGKYGWILRIVPAKIGVPAKRLTFTYKFYFRYLDLGALLAGLIGFVWGILSFKVRPV